MLSEKKRRWLQAKVVTTWDQARTWFKCTRCSCDLRWSSFHDIAECPNCKQDYEIIRLSLATTQTKEIYGSVCVRLDAAIPWAKIKVSASKQPEWLREWEHAER